MSTPNTKEVTSTTQPSTASPNDEIKSTYFEGKVYVGMLLSFPTGTYKSLELYNEALDNWIDISKRVASYSIVGPHNFKDGQDVTGLYELQYQWQTDFKGRGKKWEDCTPAVYSMAHVALRRIVAIPTQPSTVSKEVGVQEKARELVDKFKDYAYTSWHGGDDEMTTEEAAKQCAIICVDEILNALCTIYADDIVSRQVFWQSVRAAIEKL